MQRNEDKAHTVSPAATFADSIDRLNGIEQKAAKLAAIDLQLNPTSPGHQLRKLDAARELNFWSVWGS